MGTRRLAPMGASLLLILLGLVLPITVQADLVQSVSDTETIDFPQSNGGWTQELGNGLSGVATEIVFPITWREFNGFPAASGRLGISITACDDAAYTSCGSVSTNSLSFNSPVGPTSAVFKDGLTDGPLNFSFDATKYYLLRIYRIADSNPDTRFRVWGSATDIYPNGATNAGGLADIAFAIKGVDYNTPTPLPTGPTVLFLPGIEGSRLYKPTAGSEEKIWEPSPVTPVNDLLLDAAGKSVRNDIYTRDVLDTPYGTDIYGSFLTKLQEKKDEGAISDWEAAPYDWRLSLEDLTSYGNKVGPNISYTQATDTPYLLQEVRRLAAESSTHKVTIVAHSNGGLVAKQLINVLGSEAPNLIDNVIFVAVPQAGTPQAVAGLLHGHDAGLPSFFPIIFSSNSARQAGNNSPTLYNLLPSENYFTYVDTPVVTIDPVTMPDWVARYGSIIHSADTLKTFLTDTYQRVPVTNPDLETPVTLNASIIDQAQAVHASQDTWVPPAGIHLTQIAGWGVPKTIGSLHYVRRGGQIRVEPQFVVDGDGTVVAPSALWTPSSASVTNYFFNIDEYNKDTLNVVQRSLKLWNKDHGTILTIPELEQLVSDIVTGNTRALDEYKYIDTNQNDPSPKYLLYALHSPLNLDLYDTLGRHTGISTTTGEVEEQIPGSYYLRIGEVKYIFAEELGSQYVHLKGYAPGTFTLNVDEYIGNTRQASTTFLNIPTTASTTAILRVSSDISSASPLTVDENGDGVNEYTLVPKLNDVVTVPIDTNPPEIQLSLNPSDKTILLKGIDIESGTTTQILAPKATSSQVVDTAGHKLKIGFSKNDQTSNSAFVNISSLAYDSSVATSTSGLVRYYWTAPSKTAQPTILIAYLKTKDSAIVALYIASSKKTLIFSAVPADENADLGLLAVNLALKPRATLKQYPGLVVPYIASSKGKLRLGY
jgi:pimeloyl-ACP methyl ester carboxylesterase